MHLLLFHKKHKAILMSKVFIQTWDMYSKMKLNYKDFSSIHNPR